MKWALWGRWLVTGTVVSIVGLAAWIAFPISPSMLEKRPVSGVTLTDRFGATLRDTRAADGTRSRWLSIGAIDPMLIQAFVATEDHRFYEHHGVDWHGVARAVRDAWRRGHTVSGASTITMQLARRLRETPRTWWGKAEQTLWAIRLECHLSKQQILEQYLNRVDLGLSAVGVDAATALYFAHPATSVSVGQAAMLAGLAHAPAHDNPFTTPGAARERRRYALARMLAAGYISHDELVRANAEPLLPLRDPAARFLAPHFTTRVLNHDIEGTDATPPIADGDDRPIRTSLDLDLQTALEAEVRATVDAFHNRGARQAAVVVLDNATGEILAWVGSPDFWADTSGQTDLVVSPRQPGSALKPFLYGLAFDRGFTPASVIADVSRTYQTLLGPYRPRNYDRRYHGPVRAREALASSYNVPAVALTDAVGVGALLRTLRLAGFASLRNSAEHYGLGLALGNGDVTLLELANGYRVLARGGVWEPVTWRSQGAERDGKADRVSGTRVISPMAAALVLDVLSDPDARVPGFGVETPFDFPFPVAVKTGTSRHFTDNWAVAVTGGFTIATWMGNANGRPMAGISGVTGVGPLLHYAVLLTARRYSPRTLTTPDAIGATRVRICRLSGLRATARCPYTEEWFAPGMAPLRDCDWHREDGVHVPVEYVDAAAASDTIGTTERGGVPVARTKRALPSGVSVSNMLRIVSPQDGDRYEVPPGVDPRYATIALRSVGGVSPSGVRWSIDGEPVNVPRFALVHGSHRIVVRDRTDSAAVTVTVE